MNIPEFRAESSLYEPTRRYLTPGSPRGPDARTVLPQARFPVGGPVDLQECWQRCIWTPWDCPAECENVPWPTVPPQPKRMLRY
jgi:hypothetical protein